MGGEEAGGAAAVADLVLLCLAQLRHRPLVFGAGVVGDEDRVVAEAAAAAPLAEEATGADRFEDLLGAFGVDQGEHADVAGAALAARGVDLAQQLVEVGFVVGALPRVARRVDPRRATEVVGLDPGVVGEDRGAGRRVGGPRLDQGVGFEAVAVLGRRLVPLGQRLEVDLGSSSRISASL